MAISHNMRAKPVLRKMKEVESKKKSKGGTKHLNIIQVLGSNYPIVQLHPSHPWLC